ncbi:MAG: hypothetical protein ACREX8_02870 [Gammaproteobacteria bacterium]
MTAPDRSWVFLDNLAYVLVEGSANAPTFVALCGRTMPATVPVYCVAPSMMNVCRTCEQFAVLGVPPPVFPTATVL